MADLEITTTETPDGDFHSVSIFNDLEFKSTGTSKEEAESILKSIVADYQMTLVPEEEEE